jgi:glutathione synthase
MSQPTFSLEAYNRAFENPDLLEQLREDARNFCMVNGAVMVHDESVSSSVHVPCTLLPLPMPRSVFSSSTELAPLMNFLYERVARDTDFLKTVLAPAAKSDSFMATLLNILDRSVNRGPGGAFTGPLQPLALTIARSDYMLDVDPETAVVRPLQVEMNMIASSFGCLSTRVSEMHRYVIAHNPLLTETYGIDAANVPVNRAMERLADGMAAAVAAFAARHPGAHAAAAGTPAAARPLTVLMVVQKGERNSADQRHLEYALHRQHGVPMLRRSLDQLCTAAAVDPVTGALTVDGHRVALVYYRAGYTPADLPTEAEVEAMAVMELSLAVKCPSVAHHLAGTKKVQQVLASRAALERYLSPADAGRLLTLFAGIWPLEDDDEPTRALIARAVARADDYVLKPQREGGGNNHWGDDLIRTLQTATPHERAAYILMARIRATTAQQALMRHGAVSVGPCVSELGVYAVMLGDGSHAAPGAAAAPATATVEFDAARGESAVVTPADGAVATAGADTATPAGPVPLMNYYAGFLLRTKKEGTNEGGVAAGFSGLNAPYLHD